MSSRSPDLPAAFRTHPLAHRGLHDRARGVIENSRAAVASAFAAGYGVEIDVQQARCGTPMVFHDAELGRLTAARGALAELDAQELGAIELAGGGETIPTLGEILVVVDGRAPLLIEIKDADAALPPTDGAREAAVAAALVGYRGDVAVMSFNPAAVAAFGEAAPAVPRGMTTCAFDGPAWPLPDYRRAELVAIADFEATGAGFISHDRRDLERPRVAELRARGVPVLTWTVRSPAEEAAARLWADNITFEGYRPRRAAG